MKNKITVEVWEDSKSTTVVLQDDLNKKHLMDSDAIMIRTITGCDWNDCMKQHHKLMGWEPYKPF